MEYLERYYTLIAFAAYVHHPSFDGSAFNTEAGSFQAWLDKRPELQSILRRLLWRNPMGALMPPTLPLPGIVVAHQLPPDGGEAADAVVSGRAGGVLGAHCILKEEPYPGVQTGRVPVFHDGAPNFRQVPRVCCSCVFSCAHIFGFRRPRRILFTASPFLRWMASVQCWLQLVQQQRKAHPCSGTTCAKSRASTLPAARLCFARLCARWLIYANVRAFSTRFTTPPTDLRPQTLASTRRAWSSWRNA